MFTATSTSTFDVDVSDSMNQISNPHATHDQRELSSQADLIAVRPIAYIPVGSTDKSDGDCSTELTGAFAQSVCLAAAAFTGGAVIPIVALGEDDQTTVGGVTSTAADTRLENHLSDQIIGASALGARRIILFSGSTELGLLDLIRRVAVRHTTGSRHVVGLSPAIPGARPTDQSPGQLATLLQPVFAPDGLSSSRNEPGSPATDRSDTSHQHSHIPAERLRLAAELLETIINTANKDTTT